MPYIVIDIETSGLYVYKNPDGTPHDADAPDQPRVVELAIIWCDDDFNIEKEHHAYIQPNGWEMTPEGTAVNGLTTELLRERGVPIETALSIYHAAIKEGRVVVAQNAQFDLKGLRGESRRAGLDDLFDETLNICTMRSVQKAKLKIVKLNGKGGWPGLVDIAAHFEIGPWKKHSAIDDARVTVEVAKRLKQLNILLEPAVHRHPKHKDNDAGA